MELKGCKINFLGDSITEGARTSGPDYRFSNLIEAETGAVCRNYGIGGTRIAPQHKPSEKAKWDEDFCSRVAGMDEDADIIVIFGGTNDFGHGDAPFGTFSDRTPDTFCGALHTLYTSVIERWPAAHRVVITPLHRRGELEPKASNGRYFIDYVNAIRETAQYYSIPVLDLYASGEIQPAVPVLMEKFIPDGLHPSDAGHILLANRIRRFLETTF